MVSCTAAVIPRFSSRCFGRSRNVKNEPRSLKNGEDRSEQATINPVQRREERRRNGGKDENKGGGGGGDAAVRRRVPFKTAVGGLTGSKNSRSLTVNTADRHLCASKEKK